MFVIFVGDIAKLKLYPNTMKLNATTQRILLVLLSVALLSLGWLGATGLTLLVALIPLMIISERYSDSRGDWWRMCGWAALTFMLWYAATIWWVWIATPIGPITAAVVGTFYNLVAFMAYHYTAKRAKRAAAYTLLVSLWIATEYAYNSADVMTFPWLLLGNGFSGDIWAVQWYEYTGIFGGTLWVLASNIAIFEILRSRTTTAIVRALLIVTLPVAFSLWLYFSYTPSERTTQIAVVQPNVPCYEDERLEADMMNPLDEICTLVESVPAEASFVVFPESALVYLPMIGSIDEANYGRITPLLKLLHDERLAASKFLFGASTTRIYGTTPATSTAHYHSRIGWYDHYNSALLTNYDGNVENTYHKAKLVIGVEAVPLKNLFDLFEIDLGGISGQLGWGEGAKVFENDGLKLGPAICYEALYGEYFTGFARCGAEVMAVISNDGWWGNTPGHKRLFDFCRLRAIETRRAIARSANTGISGYISPRGNTLGERLTWNERDVLCTEVELRDEITTYTRYGDWVARISIYVALLSLLNYVAYRIRRRNHLVD